MKLVAVVLAVGLWATGTAAQMSSSRTAKYTGSAIPDAQAFHIWFNHFAFVLNDEANMPGLTKAEMAKTGLNEVDQSVVKGNVLTWAQSFKQLTDAYNAKVAAGTVTYNDQLTYGRALDKLATSTYNTIKSQLSTDGATRFYKFLQKEKANMGVDMVTP